MTLRYLLSVVIEAPLGHRAPFLAPYKALYIIPSMFVHRHVHHDTGTRNMEPVWRSADYLREVAFSFHLVCYRDQLRLSGLVARALPAKPSHGSCRTYFSFNLYFCF